MKRFAFTLCILIGSAAFALTQEARTNVPADPASTNQPPATNAAPATAEEDAATEKPDIKELIKLPAFTNSSGMIMVRISDKLWAGKYEVTQEEFQKVAGGNPSQFPGPSNPVESVSWNDALGFCARLTEVEREEEMLPEGLAYSLPTQSQWESFATGVDLKDAVTGSGAQRSGPSPVGSLGANSLDMHDVRGNVWEWCRDPQDKPFRVARGGAWDTFIEINLRPEFRWYSEGPAVSKNTIGFRCVLGPGAN